MKPDLKEVAESFGVTEAFGDYGREGSSGHKERTFKVTVSKFYFPRERWPTGDEFRFAQIYDSVKVKARSREEAAKLVWAKHGDKWQSKMLTNQQRGISKTVVSLNVNDPTIGQLGTSGRLSSIKVAEF